jgi:murein L,D-transpeptidase YafK
MILKKIYKVVAIGILISIPAYYLYPSPKLPANISIDKLVVLKSERKLLAYFNGRLVKTYKIALGRNPEGHKQFEGDNKTPEGVYTINDKNPNSAFHKNLGISYPNIADVENAKRLGKSPGGQIKIHGLKNGIGFITKLHLLSNWTRGCIALNNKEIDELYLAVPVGTPIEIKP